jgi:homoaconitase/3-isopropylmalate dehydratase large subunit
MQGLAVMPQLLFDKLWANHVVRDLGDGWCVLHIDRHLLHEGVSWATSIRAG